MDTTYLKVFLMCALNTVIKGDTCSTTYSYRYCTIGCCGYYYDTACCYYSKDDNTNVGLIVGVVIGSVVAMIIISTLMKVLCNCLNKKQQVGTVVSVPVNAGYAGYPVQQPGYAGYPVQLPGQVHPQQLQVTPNPYGAPSSNLYSGTSNTVAPPAVQKV